MWQHLLPPKVVLFPQLFNLGQSTTLLFYIRTAAQRQLTGFTNSVLTEGTVEDKLTPGLSFSHSKSLRKARSPPCSPKIRWWWAACTHCLPPLPMTHRVRSIFCFFPQPGFGASSPSVTGSPQNPWDIFLVEIPLIASCGCLHDMFSGPPWAAHRLGPATIEVSPCLRCGLQIQKQGNRPTKQTTKNLYFIYDSMEQRLHYPFSSCPHV